MCKSGQYWWINEGNLIELDGPFKTETDAQKAAIDAMDGIDDASIVILQAVSTGEVKHTRKAKWKYHDNR
jgi:hypothetical protein